MGFFEKITDITISLFEKTTDAMVLRVEKYPVNTKKDILTQKIELLEMHEKLIGCIHPILFLVGQLHQLLVGVEERLNLAFHNKAQELNELNN